VQCGRHDTHLMGGRPCWRAAVVDFARFAHPAPANQTKPPFPLQHPVLFFEQAIVLYPRSP